MTGKPSSKPICSSSLKPSMSAAQRSQNGKFAAAHNYLTGQLAECWHRRQTGAASPGIYTSERTRSKWSERSRSLSSAASPFGQVVTGAAPCTHT